MRSFQGAKGTPLPLVLRRPGRMCCWLLQPGAGSIVVRKGGLAGGSKEVMQLMHDQEATVQDRVH